MSDDSNVLNPSRYTFGSMSLGRDESRVEADVAVARQAMDAGVWFHSSPTYNRGFTYMVLRMAFDEDRAAVPKVIIKLRDGSARLLRFEAEDACRRLGIDAIDVGQLVSMDRGPDSLAEQLVKGGPIADELASLRDRGLVKQAVVFVNRGHAQAGLAAQSSPLVEGLTFYWNACQRDCGGVAWRGITDRQIPVLALRTLAGGPGDEKTAEIRRRVARLMAEAGIDDEVTFALRLAASYAPIRTTIGGTANPEHLGRYLQEARNPAPLPAEVCAAWEAIHDQAEK